MTKPVVPLSKLERDVFDAAVRWCRADGGSVEESEAQNALIEAYGELPDRPSGLVEELLPGLEREWIREHGELALQALMHANITAYRDGTYRDSVRAAYESLQSLLTNHLEHERSARIYHVVKVLRDVTEDELRCALDLMPAETRDRLRVLLSGAPPKERWRRR